MVRTFFIVMMAFYAMGLVGCGSSPQEREAEADATIAEERVKMMQQYRECLKTYEGKEDVAEKCAHYKDAAETFIGK